MLRPIDKAQRIGLTLLCGLLLMPRFTLAEENSPLSASALKDLNANVLGEEGSSQRERMLSDDARARLREANRRETRLWRGIDSRTAWEAYRDKRIAALRKSLGQTPAVPNPLPIKVTGEIEGDGYKIEKLVFESRPGLWVTANLYRPESPKASMPGILICHSHHNPKTQNELQDMGVMWARTGCLVLVMDQLGHGERRQHPFRSAEDFNGSFRVSRQDYYFRYNVALQLHLVGESLIGWMAWDLMRGVDLLLSRPGVDPKRILLLGAVAGGGDPTGVTGALETRLAGVVPFNFGGPQPETGRLGEDAEDAFNYAGSGSWESTRNLRLSARDGFLPWVIVGATAPRGLIYAHEFTWDREHDPVWMRLNAIFDFYKAGDRISSVHGYGAVTLSSDKASHCNNIGPAHRKGIHAAFQKWFGMEIPDEESRDRRPASELLCLEGNAAANISLTPVHKLADQLSEERLAKVRKQVEKLPASKRREQLKKLWEDKLGDVAPYPVKITNTKTETQAGMRIERFVLTGEREIRVPVLLLTPQNPTDRKQAVAVIVTQSGKADFLKEQPETVSALLENGVAVCLPDLRGIGETRPGNGRARQSWATSLSATELMLGQTLLGSRLKDLRSLLAYLRTRSEFDPRRLAVWGDSLAKVNPPGRNLRVPRGIDNSPDQAEPGGPLLALFAGLFEDDLAGVVLARGGLVSWRSLLDSEFLYVPHDAVIPGALAVSDTADIAAALAPKPLWISGLVDGQNRQVSENRAEETYAKTQQRFATANASDQFRLKAGDADRAKTIVLWLVEQMK